MSVGIKKIKIPVKKSELSIEAVAPYLQTILMNFRENATNITNNYKAYLGQHEILKKQRPYDSDSGINNQIVEPHLFSMVDFKCGYLIGNPKEYAQVKSSNDEEMQILQRIIRDCDLRTVSNDVAKWVYSTGAGYYFIQPKSILPRNNYTSPFEVFCQPTNTCCKVYSSYIGEGPLFDCIFTTIEKKGLNTLSQTYTIVDVYLPDYMYEYEVPDNTERFNLVNTEMRLLYKELPLVEQYANSDRLGIIEISKSIQNAIDNITSNELDNIQEVVNQLYILINAVLGENDAECKANFAKMKRNGFVQLASNDPNFPVDLKTLATNLDHKNIMQLKEELTQVMYDCVGVPLASSSVSSGGDTQGARQLGNGWENAYIVAEKDINNLIKADRKLLEIILWICKQSQYSGIIDLQANEIDIKYNINRSNNLLVKTQSYVNLTQNENAPVPPKLAMALCELTSDPEAVGRAIEEYKKQLQSQTIQQ